MLFEYEIGHTHSAAAACMLEKATGKRFKELFNDLKADIGLGDHPDLKYSSGLLTPANEDNPRLCGGLFATGNEMMHFVKLIYHKGEWDGNQVIHPDFIKRMH